MLWQNYKKLSPMPIRWFRLMFNRYLLTFVLKEGALLLYLTRHSHKSHFNLEIEELTHFILICLDQMSVFDGTFFHTTTCLDMGNSVYLILSDMHYVSIKLFENKFCIQFTCEKELITAFFSLISRFFAVMRRSEPQYFERLLPLPLPLHKCLSHLLCQKIAAFKNIVSGAVNKAYNEAFLYLYAKAATPLCTTLQCSFSCTALVVQYFRWGNAHKIETVNVFFIKLIPDSPIGQNRLPTKVFVKIPNLKRWLPWRVICFSPKTSQHLISLP